MEEMETESKIESYMDEEIEVTLTRREIYWLRGQSKKRMDAAMHGMTAVGARPAKRSMRREEYEFHRNLVSRLYGVEPDEEELEALRQAEAAREAIEMEERAAKLRERADLLMEEAKRRVGL